MKCPVYKAFCSEHGFAHGAEAEDLRKGIEGLLFARVYTDSCSIPSHFTAWPIDLTALNPERGRANR